MIIRIPYGLRPCEKIVSEGFFACPYCFYKRHYVKTKVVKEYYFGFINIPSSKALMEYVHCGGCLNIYSTEILKPEKQLEIKISDQPKPPDSFFNEWEFAYSNLKCDEIYGDNPEFRELRSPIMITIIGHMKKAGVSIKLKMYDETKMHMYNILSNKWFEYKSKSENKNLKNNTAADNKVYHFSTMAHYMLSLLP